MSVVMGLTLGDEIEIEIEIDVVDVERRLVLVVVVLLLVVPRQSSCVGGFVIDVLMLVIILIPHPRVAVCDGGLGGFIKVSLLVRGESGVSVQSVSKSKL